MLKQLKYKWYSRKYKKRFSSEFIEKFKKGTIIYYLGRQNGKTILAIKYEYIRLVENYDFKAARQLLKSYKKLFKKNLF